MWAGAPGGCAARAAFCSNALQSCARLGVLGFSRFRDFNGTLEQNFLGIKLKSLTEGM